MAIATTMIFSGSSVFAQLVAFTGKDSNSPDEFAFVALQDLPDGTQIFFSESDYNNANNTVTVSEGHLRFTVSGTLSTGTVVQISETGANTFTVTGNGGSATHIAANDWSMTASDPLIAYSSGPTSSTPWVNVSEVHAMMWVTNVALGTRDPSPNHPNAIVLHGFASTQTAADFTGNRAATLSSFSDISNYTTGDGDLDLTDFSTVPVELMSLEIE